MNPDRIVAALLIWASLSVLLGWAWTRTHRNRRAWDGRGIYEQAEDGQAERMRRQLADDEWAAIERAWEK